jgi:beta-lactamase regulating signal transducer with metallopeptidase domain
MAPFVEYVLSNSAAAVLLAPLAYASKWLRRPALTHILWLIVLVRLITPPAYSMRVVYWNAEPIAQTIATTQSPEPLPGLDFFAIESLTRSDEWGLQEPAEPAPPISATVARIEVPWTQITFGIWATFSTLVVAGMIGRVFAFCRSLRHGKAPDQRLGELVEALSQQMGLVRPPRVVLLADRISPCVCSGVLRPILALPTGWLEGLTRLQQSAVLVHELAHLRRRDHWVRWLETIAFALCWWHPVVWLARRELREAEELCCDGWVVATLPAARRAYADALVDTLDFLAIARPALPPLASGFGQVHELKRRIHMILKVNPAYRPGRAGAILALGLALLLPFGVARSDEPQDTPAPPEPPRPSRNERELKEIEARDRARAAEDRARAAEERARARGFRDLSDEQIGQIKRLKDEIQEAEKQMAEAKARLDRLRRRMEDLGMEPRPVKTPTPRGENTEIDRELKALRDEEQSLLTQYGPNHPLVRQNQGRQERLKQTNADTAPRRRPAGGDLPRANDANMERNLLKLRLQELEMQDKLGADSPEIQQLHKQLAEIKQAMGERSRGRAGSGGFGGGDSPRAEAPGYPPQPPTPPVNSPPGRNVPATPFARNPGPGAGGMPGGDPRIDELARAVSDLRKMVEEMRRDRERDRRLPPGQPNP